MEHYKTIILDTLQTLTGDGRTRDEILQSWYDGETEDDFGNLTGSRTCNAWQAEQDLKAAGFPFNSDINDLIESVGYNIAELLERGPECIDVIICELLAPQVAAEMMGE